jgi:predicted NAD-dependent protein-ADP-ribosyltransferase YbiA (DUF1768 family)
MAANCTYTYKDKTYSTDRIYRTLVSELPSRSQQESIDFLKRFLGMSEDEIIIVKDLIDQRSLGRFKADGKILLSDLATVDVAYHEAFHRVWRMYLNSTERLAGITEIKRRKNIGKTIDGYREIYPKLSENELIEEIIADEFADYNLNTNFKTALPLKSLFQRLVNFIKRLLGLKPQQVQMIYDKILAGKYKGKSQSAQQYLKDADKLIIQGQDFTVEQKNELTQVLTQRFVEALLDVRGDLDIFLNKGNTKMFQLLDVDIIPGLGSDLLDINEEAFGDLLDAFYADVDQVLKNGQPIADSIFLDGMIKSLKLLGLEIKDESEDLSEGSLDSTEQKTREFAASIEFDPKSKMGKKIKLLLSSLVDNSETTPAFGFAKPLSWTRGFVQIATRMAGIPTSAFMEELRNTGLPYINTLISHLEKDVNFRDKFISTMAMTENKFMTMRFKEGDIYFYDANSGTRQAPILNTWKNSLTKKIEDWDQWKLGLAKLADGKPTNEEILEHFGFEVNPAIENLQTDLRTLVQQASKYKGDKPDSANLFKNLGIKGYTENLAAKQSKFEDAVDLMVTLNGKKLYTLGLNTQQTSIINSIRYAQSKFTPEMTQAQKIDLIREYAPFQVSEFNVTKLVDGSYAIHNKWLDKILNGENLELVIPYNTNSPEDDIEISKLDEADLMALHINGALQGVNMSMKHGDRSTFFAYTFGLNKPLYTKGNAGTVGDNLSILESNIIEQLELEVKFFRDMTNRNLPVQYIGETEETLKDKTVVKKIPPFFKDVFGDTAREEFNKVLDGGKINENLVKRFVGQQFADFKKEVIGYGLLDTYEHGRSVKGINNSILRDFGNTDTLLASAFVNEVSSHMFETRFFSGSVQSFKSGTDLFKRLVPQSSTGNLSVNDTVIHDEVRNKLNQEFEVINPKTGKAQVVNPSLALHEGKEKLFRAVTGAERENYKSHMLNLAETPTGKPVLSKLTGKQESKLFMLYESGFIKDFPEKSLEEISKIYLKKIRLYEKKYEKINENDGQSYMTLPAFKNFMLRQGNWSDGMEVVYQTEMKIASLKSKEDIANIEVTINGQTFKPFEINVTTVDGKKYDGWKNRIVNGKLVKLDAVHTLKTQFAGYSTPEEYFEEMKGEVDYWFNSVFKTSQHLLLPSAVLGTNLQLMNYSLLSNGIDIYHMGSANKVGGVDAKLAAKNILNNNDDIRNSRTSLSDLAERGLDFYDKDGYFNHDALTENLDVLTYLSNWDALKDQVAIGNKVKTEIKGSTQSLKILLSNLIVNGLERFVGAKQLVDSYKEVVKEMVQQNHDNLLKKIGFNVEINDFDTLDKLKDSVLKSSQMQNAPENIRNSVENFFSDPELGIEAIPMKNKIENVLYSLITNGIISFDRPGNSYPLATVTGYEELGSRKFDENGIQQSNQEALKFYNPVFDEEGNVTKIEPAEVIMPIPDKWIPKLLRWARTNNLAKALDKLNEDISVRPELYQFKGAYIPNQQLSSNEFFQVKRFNLPTMQNYLIVPSETVVKTGRDFDIDKGNIYWARDSVKKIFGGVTEEEIQEEYEDHINEATEQGEEVLSFEQFKALYNTSLDRILLNQEKEILLHPSNAHHLLMPLTDEIFVKDIYDFLVEEGLIETPNKTWFGSMLPQTNVKNSTIFVKGKFGVGPVALGITNSATNQADGLSVARIYNNNDGVARPSKLLFKGLEDVYTLDNYTDNKGTIISEILSQLLTTQVDNVKNPTAVLMNINMQTLGVMIYLVRRRVDPKSVALLLQQPLVKEYLRYQRQNESQTNKNAKTELRKEGPGGLIAQLLKDKGYPNWKDKLPDSYVDFSISDNNMLKSAKEGKFNEEQLKYLNYFLEVQGQSRTFSDFQATQNSDTKGLKDKQSLDEADVIRGRVGLSQLITPEDVSRLDSEGVISPFYQLGRKRYSIFDRFYALQSSLFAKSLTDFKNNAAAYQTGSNKDRVRQTIENDFMLFLVHNFTTSKMEFDRLMKGDSVAKKVLELKKKLSSNLVLKAFFPMINNSTDLSDPAKRERIDSLRIFEKELNQLDSNDLRLSLEEIADTDIELYNDIVKLLMFQTGLNISPFNYRAVIPVGLNQNRNEFNEYQYLYADILKEAIQKMKSQIKTKSDADSVFKQFITLFSANNPQFLRTHTQGLWNGSYPYTLGKTFNRAAVIKDKSGSTSINKNEPMWILRPIKGNETQPQLGDAYHKQYFVEQINPNLNNTSKPKQSQAKEDLNSVFNDDIPFTDYEDVTNPKVLALPENVGEKTLNIYFGSNENKELSNLASRPFRDKDGRNYYSVEHAYQSWKSGEFDKATYDRYKSGGVKLSGNKGTKTENNWNLDLMKRLIKSSLEQNPKVLQLLLDTGNTKLTHTQEKGLWGTEFPKLLMEVRDELKNLSKQTALPEGEKSIVITKTLDNTIEYTPIGKTRQTYTVEGTKIINKDGKEVFKEASKDRNKIFANFAVKQKRAVIVEHRDVKYVVNQKDQIISVTTGDEMKWTSENGNRKAILSLAKQKFSETTKDQITQEDIDGAQKIFELDQSQSNYSPSLKMYEGFIQLNQLYTGDEILPFIGKSEYYRYLVPMLLKMNPKVGTEITDSIRRSVRNRAYEDNLFIDDLTELSNVDYSKAWGMSIRQLNSSFVRTDAPVKTIVHELMHRTLQKEYEKKGEFYNQINDTFDYAVSHSIDQTLYGYDRPEEFLAEALANPDFMEELNNIPYKEETIWTYLMTLISDFINNLLNIELKSDSVLAEVVRVSEQVLNNNLTELGKKEPVVLSDMQKNIVENWNEYFPDYSWMNYAQKQMTAKLVEEGKITLNCSF